MEIQPSLLGQLAQSPNIALLFSLIVNAILGRMLIRLYQSKELLHEQLVVILKEIIPVAVRLKDKIDAINK